MTSTDEITSRLSAMYNNSKDKITGAREFDSYPELGVTVFECEILSPYFGYTGYVVTSKKRNIKLTKPLGIEHAAAIVGLISELDIDLNLHTPEYYKEALRRVKFRFCMENPGSLYDTVKDDALCYLTYMCQAI